MPPTPAATKADPNVFFASMLAGCLASGVAKGIEAETWIDHCKQGWRAHVKLVDWALSGEAEREAAEIRAKQAALQEKLERVAREDAEAERLRHEKAVAAHGAK